MPLYFDATFSWSGYAYQGKVGVFLILKYLNQYNGSDLNVYFNDWELEFEWLEDFSIKQSGIYRSLHQVKTSQSTRVSSYNTAITQTIENAQNAFNYHITAYFHVSSNVVNPNAIFYEYHINGNDQQYCPLNEIDNLVKEQIGIFLAKYNNGEAIDTHFNKLLAILDNHVSQRHQNIQNIPRNIRQIECINFTEIINSLLLDSTQLNQTRIEYELKAYFVSIMDEFCQDKSNIVKIKINDICRELLDDNNFINFIKSISPHIFISSDDSLTLRNFKELLENSGTKDSFFESICCIENFNTFVINKYLDKDSKKYLPTTINRRASAQNEVCQKILNNPFAIENLFEMDCFITERITCESIEDDAYNTTEIRVEDLPDRGSQEYKITELKKVEMIKIEDAERILNA